MENEDNLMISEEPLLIYYSTTTNFGVQAKNIKSPKNLCLSFSPHSSNCQITFSNTIMNPLITSEEYIENKKNVSMNTCEISKNNTRLKTVSSKDEKYNLNDYGLVIIENENSKKEESLDEIDEGKDESISKKESLELNHLSSERNFIFDIEKYQSDNKISNIKKGLVKQKAEDNNVNFTKLCREKVLIMNNNNNIDNENNQEKNKSNKSKFKKMKFFNITTAKRKDSYENTNNYNSVKKIKFKYNITSNENNNSNKPTRRIRNSDKYLFLDTKKFCNFINENNNQKNKKRSRGFTIKSSNKKMQGNNMKIVKASLFNKMSSSKINPGMKTFQESYFKEKEKADNERPKKIRYTGLSQKALKIYDSANSNKKENNKLFRLFEQKKPKKNSDKKNLESELNSEPIEALNIKSSYRKKHSKSIYFLRHKVSDTGEKKNTKKKKSVIKRLDFEITLKSRKNLANTQFNLFSPDKFTNTEFIGSDFCEYTLGCMELILNKNKSQRQQKPKVNFNFPKSPKNKIKKKIALFDLDETLVHCTGETTLNNEKYQHEINITLPGNKEVKVGINIRPLWKKTLKIVRKYYYIVIFTASHQAYADAVLNFMDPQNKYFKYRLYRNNCSLVDVDGAKFYVKDLDIFDEHYDLKDIVIIDNSVLSFIYHLENGIPIVPYYNEDQYGSLYIVGQYLEHIFKEDDLRIGNKKYINLESFLNEVKMKNKEETPVDEEPKDIIDNNNKGSVNNSSPKKEIPVNTECINNDTFNSEEEDIEVPDSNKKGCASPIEKNLQSKLISKSTLFNMYYEISESNKKITEFWKKKSENSIKSFSSEEDEEEKEINENQNKNDIGEAFFQKRFFSIQAKTNNILQRHQSNKTDQDHLNIKMIRSKFGCDFSKK